MDETTVRSMLDAAAIPATDREIALLADGYPDNRASVNALYAVPAARYADPALRFRASARLTPWS